MVRRGMDLSPDRSDDEELDIRGRPKYLPRQSSADDDRPISPMKDPKSYYAYRNASPPGDAFNSITTTTQSLSFTAIETPPLPSASNQYRYRRIRLLVPSSALRPVVAWVKLMS